MPNREIMPTAKKWSFAGRVQRPMQRYFARGCFLEKPEPPLSGVGQ
jgi:hypothetical protein